MVLPNRREAMCAVLDKGALSDTSAISSCTKYCFTQLTLGCLMKHFLLGLSLLAFVATGSAQQATVKWYKFSKVFISEHYSADSAIGKFEATAVFPNKKVHSISCGGNDGELHMGVAEKAVKWSQHGAPFSALANQADSKFGIVAEPVNLTSTTQTAAQALSGKTATFTGYFRAWAEGHDAGKIYPSNPHHVLELHPMWKFDGSGKHFSSPTSIRSIRGYQGYGASKFKPMLLAVKQEKWLHVYEDADFVYVELKRADNFYQLPVAVKSVRNVTGAVEATVDVFSDKDRKNLVLKDLRVVANAGSAVATRLSNGEKLKFLLGIFSVNLQLASTLAKGHDSKANAAFASSALEFFAFGVPLGHAVASGPPACPDDVEADD